MRPSTVLAVVTVVATPVLVGAVPTPADGSEALSFGDGLKIGKDVLGIFHSSSNNKNQQHSRDYDELLARNFEDIMARAEPAPTHAAVHEHVHQHAHKHHAHKHQKSHKHYHGHKHAPGHAHHAEQNAEHAAAYPSSKHAVIPPAHVAREPSYSMPKGQNSFGHAGEHVGGYKGGQHGGYVRELEDREFDDIFARAEAASARPNAHATAYTHEHVKGHAYNGHKHYKGYKHGAQENVQADPVTALPSHASAQPIHTSVHAARGSTLGSPGHSSAGGPKKPHRSIDEILAREDGNEVHSWRPSAQPIHTSVHTARGSTLGSPGHSSAGGPKKPHRSIDEILAREDGNEAHSWRPSAQPIHTSVHTARGSTLGSPGHSSAGGPKKPHRSIDEILAREDGNEVHSWRPTLDSAHFVRGLFYDGRNDLKHVYDELIAREFDDVMAREDDEIMAREDDDHMAPSLNTRLEILKKNGGRTDIFARNMALAELD
ncbi:hypothetical protein BKA93DRAFT_54135 [Sparassis latifolia]